MSRLEQLRAELERIKQEAAQREAAKLAQQRADKYKEIERARLVESNWSLSQSEIIKVLSELNRTVLNSKGEVKDWKRVSSRHNHLYRVAEGDGFNEHIDRIENDLTIAELGIPGIGKIFFFRPLYHKVTHLTSLGNVYQSWEKPLEQIYYSYSKKSEKPCVGCALSNFYLGLQPKEVKDKIEEGTATCLKALFSKFYSR